MKVIQVPIVCLVMIYIGSTFFFGESILEVFSLLGHSSSFCVLSLGMLSSLSIVVKGANILPVIDQDSD